MQPRNPKRETRYPRLASYALIATLAAASCTPNAFLNNFASLGGNTPGSRGSVQVVFRNQTPFRAIFTYGVYDQQDQGSVPEFQQFTAGADVTTRLEGNTDSDVVTFQCGRTLAVGTADFIQRVRDNADITDADEKALRDGIAFSDRPLDDEGAADPTAGTDAGIAILQGVEFPCGRTPTTADDPNGTSLVIFTLVQDANEPDGFRITYEVLLP